MSCPHAGRTHGSAHRKNARLSLGDWNEAELAQLLDATFLPGIDVRNGVLLIDESKLIYPGDILHEAGHLAIMPAERRRAITHDAGPDAGEEMAAIAWSYAAAIHLKIELSAVFHEGGYRGGSRAIMDNFAQGRYIGVPILQWLGMTSTARRQGCRQFRLTRT